MISPTAVTADYATSQMASASQVATPAASRRLLGSTTAAKTMYQLMYSIGKISGFIAVKAVQPSGLCDRTASAAPHMQMAVAEERPPRMPAKRAEQSKHGGDLTSNADWLKRTKP